MEPLDKSHISGFSERLRFRIPLQGSSGSGDGSGVINWVRTCICWRPCEIEVLSPKPGTLRLRRVIILWLPREELKALVLIIGTPNVFWKSPHGFLCGVLKAGAEQNWRQTKNYIAPNPTS